MAAEKKDRLYEINRAAADFYHAYLMSEEGETALAYLKSRNVTLDTIQFFGIGAAPDERDGLMRHLTEKGYSVAEMAESGLIMPTQNNRFLDRFRARIMFPIADVEGKPVSFCGRALLSDPFGPRFLNTPNTLIYDKGESLFGLNIAKNYGSDQIVLVEGILDAISLYQAGIKGVVAVQGVHLTERHAAILLQHTEKVVIFYDSDPPGKKGAERTAAIFEEYAIPTATIILEDCKDPCDYVAKYGGEKLKELIALVWNTSR